jgi:DNA-binding NtrC family response regulator
VAATNRAVQGEGGALRGDILGRLGAAPVILPPLRDRKEDLGALCRFFLARAAGGELPAPAFEAAAFRALCLHGFPLNVRELEKMLGAAFALTGGKRPIALRDLPPLGPLPERAPAPAPEKSGRRPPAPGPTAGELEALLAEHQGNVAEVSRALGRQRAAVWRWIKQFGLGVDRHRK